MWATHPGLLVGVGSATGGILRYYLGRAVDRWMDSPFPWGTFVINFLGSLVLGFLAFVIHERMPPSARWAYLLFGTGFCGGFTTFSTFSYEVFKFLRGGSWEWAVLYSLGSIFAGVFGVLMAYFLCRWMC